MQGMNNSGSKRVYHLHNLLFGEEAVEVEDVDDDNDDDDDEEEDDGEEEGEDEEQRGDERDEGDKPNAEEEAGKEGRFLKTLVSELLEGYEEEFKSRTQLPARKTTRITSSSIGVHIIYQSY